MHHNHRHDDMIRVAINGFGRIGRNILRALYERNLQHEIQIVAINDLGSPEINAHLLQFDTTHGQFAFSVEHIDNGLKVEGQCIEILAIRNPAELPWERLEVDVVYECTGLFTSKVDGLVHIHAGAKKVIISAPGNEVDATIVYGVNDQILNDQMQVISNASCTTNCLAPLAKALDDAFGLEDGQITTIHAFTNDQKLTCLLYTSDAADE